MKNLDELIDFTKADGRICPQPQKWNEMWEMLPNRKRVDNGWQPPLPLILTAWHHTSDEEKRDRFLIHLQYAADHNVFPQVAAFLSSLSMNEWYCG
jgi:hypothetical protein